MDRRRLRDLIARELPSLVDIRHDLHRHPQTNYEETYASGVIQRELAALGVEFKGGLAGGTGVVAHLPATTAPGRAQPAIALRADMDALPITEHTGKPYASTIPGRMHACGHDGHTAILIGVARVLSGVDRPRGVTLVFQPAEEGGAGGAAMCKDGALRGSTGGGVGPPVGEIFALHGWPQLDLGLVASKAGPLLASTDEFEIIVHGQGGHAAYPHLCRDPIVGAAQVVVALQTVVSRAVAPYEAAVVTVGVFEAGTANNIIPASARLVGTARSLTPQVRQLLEWRIRETAESAAAGAACRAEVRWSEGYPPTINDEGATERFFAAAGAALGESRVRRVETATMGGEDFSYYGRHVPACFFMLGLKPPGAAAYPALHQPDFDFNDEAIPVGVEAFCALATAG